uniref:NMDA receptor synaptonuclear signaling and neuronal migration factor b n=2 Tax=Cyprinus carpio TaxID=7962 RepID=A0A8C1K7Q0_CYPCA
YLSHTHPENRNGSDHLLSDTFIGQDTDSPDIKEVQPGSQSAPLPTSSKRRLSVERSLSSEDQHHQRCAESSLKPARVYTITRERNMLGSQGSKESLELEVLKRTTDPPITNHHYSHPPLTQPLQSSGSAHNIRDWGSRRSRSREDCMPDCVDCIRPHCQSQRSLDLETSPHGGGKQHKKLERMYSEDRVSYEDREDHTNSWFPKENMFSFQTATTTMQDLSSHWLFMCLCCVSVYLHIPSSPGADLQASSGNLEEEDCDDVDWEEERELERAACEGDDFIPPKIMLISSKVPKAEYVPNIIIRDDPSIIPILYDHEHATFDDILEEIEKKLTAYRKGCKIWNMLIFCQGGPGHLYLLKNKVATFAKVEKEEDMIQFWKRLGRFMSLLNPEPNLIHIMGCYVLGNANGEKLFQNLKRLMKPHVIEFKSPLELSAQGKEMIEMYFDFRLYRLWKSRQHSKLLDYDDLL